MRHHEINRLIADRSVSPSEIADLLGVGESGARHIISVRAAIDRFSSTRQKSARRNAQRFLEWRERQA